MIDPFALFGLEPTFELDLEALGARHKELSLSAHPDRVKSDRALRRAAISHSIDLNQAHRVLRDPLTRAEALLRLRGAEELLEVKVSEGFLFEILELREELSEASAKKERPKLEKLLGTATSSRAAAEASLSRLFGVSEPGSEERKRLGETLSRLRYFRRFEDEAKAILDEL